MSGAKLHGSTLRAADLEMTWLSKADLMGRTSPTPICRKPSSTMPTWQMPY